MRKINTSLPLFIDYESMGLLMEDMDKTVDDVTMPWNSFGGSSGAGQMFASYLGDREKKTNVDVAGMAASMGAFLLPFFDHVKGANQADVMIHSVFSGESSTHGHTNEFLYKSVSAKIDEVKFKEVTGYDLKEVMFPKDGNRIDVWITGKDAGYIGFFDETYDLLDKIASVDSEIDLSKLGFKLPDNIKQKYGLKKETKKNNTDMEIKDVTVDKLAKGNVEVYESIQGTGKKLEQDRVAEIMKYAKFDMKKAEELIISGEKLTTDHVEHFMEKKHNKKAVVDLENASEEELAAAKATENADKKVLTKEEEEKQAALKRVKGIIGVPEEEAKK